MEHMTKEEWEQATAELMRAIYKALIATGTPAEQVTTIKADGNRTLELTHIPLEVWQHIGIDGQAIIKAIQADRKPE